MWVTTAKKIQKNHGKEPTTLLKKSERYLLFCEAWK